MRLYGSRLLPAQQSVGRTEKRGVYKLVGLGDVAHVLECWHFHSLQMMHGVVSPRVATTFDFVQQVRGAAHIVAHKEKGGFHPVMIKEVKHPRGDRWHGTVVEGQIHHFPAFFPEAPKRLRKKKSVS